MHPEPGCLVIRHFTLQFESQNPVADWSLALVDTQFQFKDKVVVVTGAGGGLGKAYSTL